MRVFSIAWKDFRHTYRNVAGLAMMIVAPLLLATALGAAFGAGGNFSVPPIKTALVNLDAGGGAAAPDVNAGSSIVQALTSADLSNLLTVTQMDNAQAARDAVDRGDADVAVIIPADLTAAVTSRQGGNSQVLVYKDPSLTIGPAIVSAITQSVVQGIDGARAAAATVRTAGSVSRPDRPDRTFRCRHKDGAGVYQGRPKTPPPVTVTDRGPVIAGRQGSPRTQCRQPGAGGHDDLLHVLRRPPRRRAASSRSTVRALLAASSPPRTPRSFILGGKYVAVYLIVLMQSVILLLAGRLFYNAHWGAIGPVVALTLCGALVAASLGLLTVSFAKTPGQAGAVGSAIFVFLGLVGGNFVGTANVGGTFALVRRITPNGWLLEGWQHVLYGGSWSTVYVPLLAAFGFAVVFFAVATFFFRRRYA